MELKKNDIIEIKILKTLLQGFGMGTYNDIIIFVPNTCADDYLKVRIVKVKSTYCYGIIEEIIEPSKHRINKKCKISSKCGGCAFDGVDYNHEVCSKLSGVNQNLEKIGKINADVNADEIVKSCEIYGYRNKAQIPVGLSAEGEIVAGFYAKHSHRIIPYEDCPLQPKLFCTTKDIIIDWMKKNKISPYNEETRKGLIRHIYLRYAGATDQLMVCIVATQLNLPFESELLDNLKQQLGNLKTFLINKNDKNTNVILGDKNRILYGDAYITDKIGQLSLRISPFSFYQINRPQTEKLYSIAKEFAGLTGNETVLDLYCGIGSIGLFMANDAKKVFGIEIVPQAVKDAKYNADINKIDNIEFLCLDIVKSHQYLETHNINPDIVVMDPPRKGCGDRLLNTIAKISPKKIVYVSCDPATLARDLNTLQSLGYDAKKARCVDMFPRTAHVETVCLMSRVEGK